MSATPASPAVLIEAAGLPSECDVKAFAPLIDRTSSALVSGLVNHKPPSFFALRAKPRVYHPTTFEVEHWDAVAFVSTNPALVFDQFSAEDQERLRAESQIPAGAEKPIGQAAVIGKSEPVPYAPPLQEIAPDTYAPDEIELDDPRDVTEIEQAACGGPMCVVIGTQVSHAADCPDYDPQQP